MVADDRTRQYSATWSSVVSAEFAPGSHVITMVKAPDGRMRWFYVGLPGHEEEAGRELDEAMINRPRMLRKFFELLGAQLAPGATILITQLSVGVDGQRGWLTIMDAVISRP